MTDPSGPAPHWSVSPAGDSAAADVILDSPAADATVGPTSLFLRVFAEGDGFRWSAYYKAEEGAPFNEGEIKWGSAADLEEAKREARAEAWEYLNDLGYTDDEIATAVPQSTGSIELDLADDDDE